jgi:hypothetical protein
MAAYDCKPLIDELRTKILNGHIDTVSDRIEQDKDVIKCLHAKVAEDMDDDVSTLLHFVIDVLGRDELKLNERLLTHLFKPKTLGGISPVLDPENMDYNDITPFNLLIDKIKSRNSVSDEVIAMALALLYILGDLDVDNLHANEINDAIHIRFRDNVEDIHEFIELVKQNRKRCLQLPFIIEYNEYVRDMRSILSLGSQFGRVGIRENAMKTYFPKGQTGLNINARFTGSPGNMSQTRMNQTATRRVKDFLGVPKGSGVKRRKGTKKKRAKSKKKRTKSKKIKHRKRM